MKRRALLGGVLAVGSGSVGLVAAEPDPEPEPSHRLTVVVVGAHPDDPESACGGVMARYAALGHDVVALYLTRGEAGIPGTPADEAARIRTAEAEKACRILGARPVFAGQIDGATEVDNARYQELSAQLHGLSPDVVFVHWPVDSHKDHRAASLLVYQAWLEGPRFPLFYYECMTGIQSQDFHPTHYLDITAVEPKKREALFCHASQNPNGAIYEEHELMERFRGMESGTELAEAFVRHAFGNQDGFPGLR